MSKFTPCISRQACREDGTHCSSCGRPHDEINRTREAINALCQLVLEANYDNVDEFLDYVQSKCKKKIAHRREKLS